jgi:hypothetical protein
MSQLQRHVLDALECIGPILTSFDKVTKQYSAAEPKLHDVLLTYLELKQSFEENAIFEEDGVDGWVRMVDKASSTRQVHQVGGRQ